VPSRAASISRPAALCELLGIVFELEGIVAPGRIGAPKAVPTPVDLKRLLDEIGSVPIGKKKPDTVKERNGWRNME
jgi:hypothetical protein